MNAFAVVLTHDAERDLEDLYDYIAEHDSQANAERALDRQLEVTEALVAERQRSFDR